MESYGRLLERFGSEPSIQCLLDFPIDSRNTRATMRILVAKLLDREIIRVVNYRTIVLSYLFSNISISDTSDKLNLINRNNKINYSISDDLLLNFIWPSSKFCNLHSNIINRGEYGI